MYRLLNQPVLVYLIIAVVSVISALLFYTIGGSAAKVWGDPAGWSKVGFEASGAIAGFLLVFCSSVKVLDALRKQENWIKNIPISIKVHLSGQPEKFNRYSSDYKCEYSLYDEDSGEQRNGKAICRWENGYMTITIKDVRPTDLLSITVRATGDSKVWKCEYFHSRSTIKQMELVNSIQ